MNKVAHGKADSKRHRVAFIQSHELFPDFRMYRELELLRGLNVELHVIVWQHTAVGEHIGSVPGVTVHPVYIPALHGMGAKDHLRKQPLFFRRVYKELGKIEPDLIVAHNFDSAVPAVWYRLAHGLTPVIYVSREPYHKVFRLKTGSRWGEALGWFADAAVGHLASAVFAVTPRMLQMYRQMGITARWMPNAPTKEFLVHEPEKEHRDFVTIGFVGNLRPSCGIEEMWDAVNLLDTRDPGKYKMLLCGLAIGGFEKAIEQMKDQNSALLDLRPPIYPTLIPSLYQEIDIVFQFPAPTEKYLKYGLNVKIYEALATGTPVLMAKTSENPSFLQDVEAAVVVPDLRPEILAREIERIAGNRRLRKEMGRSGRKFIQERFNWDLFSPLYRATAERLIGA